MREWPNIPRGRSAYVVSSHGRERLTSQGATSAAAYVLTYEFDFRRQDDFR